MKISTDTIVIMLLRATSSAQVFDTEHIKDLNTAFDLKADHCRATCSLADFPDTQGEYQM